MTLPLRRWTRRFDSGELVLRDARGEQRADLDPARLEVFEARVASAVDPALSGWVGTSGGVVAKLVPRLVHAELPAGSRLTVEASAEGPPGAHVLATPLRVSVDGAGMLLVGLGPSLTLRAAALHPDGRVTLEPAGSAGRRRLSLVARVLSALAVRRPALARHLRVGVLVAAAGCKGVTGSTCEQDGTVLRCPHDTIDVDGRQVHVALPEGEPPDGGWPVAWMLQGSFAPASLYVSASSLTPAGGVHGVETTAALLDGGVAVLAPEAHGDGFGFWDTNVPPWAGDWDGSPDAAFFLAIEASVDAGELGPLSSERWGAVGISSGGYMASRLAVWQPDRFDAIAIVAASYASCSGVLCQVPDELPADHPPTVFLHGALDPVVPVATMRPYHDRLAAEGVEVAADVRPLGVHAFPGDTAEVAGGWLLDRL